LTASPDPNAIQVTEIARIAITHDDGSQALTAARTNSQNSRPLLIERADFCCRPRAAASLP
jgi:hypothetical protein